MSPDEALEEYSQSRPTCLLLSHQLSRTGAPGALFLLSKILKKSCNVVVASVEEGELSEDFIKAGIPVVIVGRYWEMPGLFNLFGGVFDFILANTVLNFPAAMLLSGSPTPVFWWIHEHENYFSFGKGEIPNPKDLGANITVLAANRYVRRVIEEEFSYSAEILTPGVEDYFSGGERTTGDDGDYKFLIVGTYGKEKGQDILPEAWDLLSDECRGHLSLVFVGDEVNYDEAVFNRIKTLSEENEKVTMLPLMEKRKLQDLYADSRGVIVPSRKETLSLVAVESMAAGGVAVVSSDAGIAEYITPRENGFVFPSENPRALAKILEEVVTSPEIISGVSSKARALYEMHFSMGVFESEIERLILGRVLLS